MKSTPSMEKSSKLLMVTTHEKQNTQLKTRWEWSNTPCGANMEELIFPRPSSGGVVVFFTSAEITGVQMGEMSKLGWLIGWSNRDMWAASFYFLYVVLDWICRTFASFQRILWLSSYECWATFDFSSKPCVKLYLCSLMHSSRGLLVSPM
jgi:hypothetical protein